MIFTSGSTGRAKGVRVSHRGTAGRSGRGDGLRRFVAGGAGPGSCAHLVQRRLSELVLVPLARAAGSSWRRTACSAAELACRSPSGRCGWAARRRYSVSWWSELADVAGVRRARLAGARRCRPAVGGSSARMPRRRGADQRLRSDGGTTVDLRSVASGGGRRGRCLGRPIANTRVYVLDSARRASRRSGCWASSIGGDGLARGYLGRPELTAERFVPDPSPVGAGSAALPDGGPGAVAAGRAAGLPGPADHQVKVRGFRIELAEIESALTRLPAVARGGGGAWRRPRARQSPGRISGVGDAAALPRLRGVAPGSRAAGVHGAGRDRPRAALPLTAQRQNGPSSAADRSRTPSAPGRRLTAPRTPVEEILAAIWAEVLGMAASRSARTASSTSAATRCWRPGWCRGCAR